MNNAAILIVDDEVQIRKLLNITLQSNSYKVHGSFYRQGSVVDGGK